MGKTYKDIRRAKEKRDLVAYDHWAWLSSCPWRWRHQMMIVPARAEQRQKLHEVMTGKSEDDGNWPNYRKPHVYYW